MSKAEVRRLHQSRSGGDGSPRIAVIGGRGAIGSLVLTELRSRHDLRLVMAGRDLEAARKSAAQLAATGDPATSLPETRRLDVIGNEDDAVAVLSDCDIVVNASGPSWRTSVPAARVARRAGAHFIDIGGYDLLSALTRPWARALEQEGKAFIGSAGWMPGLSEVFARYVLEQAECQGERAREVELACGARDRWSDGSVSDMIWHLKHHGDSGWFEEGAWSSVSPWRSTRRRRFPDPVGAERTFALYNGQFVEWAAQRPDLRLVTLLGLLDGRTKLSLLIIKSFLLGHHARAVSLLHSAITRNCDRRGPLGMLHVTVRRADGTAAATGTLIESRNQWITALVAAKTVEFLLAGRLRGGAHALGDVAPAGDFLQALSESGVAFSVERPR